MSLPEALERDDSGSYRFIVESYRPPNPVSAPNVTRARPSIDTNMVFKMNRS